MYGGLLKNLPELKPGELLEQGEIIDLGLEFGYLADGRPARELFVQKHKSHEKRGDDFPDAIEKSTMPVTYLMVQAHLTKHGGRAKAAADMATDLCDCNTLSKPEDCLMVARLYLKTADRLTMILKKLQMPTLRWKIVQAVRLVAPAMRILEEIEVGRLQNITKEKQKKKDELAAVAKGKRLKDSSGSKRRSSSNSPGSNSPGSNSPGSNSPGSKKTKSPPKKSNGGGEEKSERKKAEDGDEGDEGNEGDEGDEGDEVDEDEDGTASRPTSSKPVWRAPASFHLAPGPLFCGTETYPLAAAVAQIVRDAMQWVFRFDRASSLVQRQFRSYILKRDGREHRRYVSMVLTRVQSWWRGALDRRVGLALQWQHASPWEQLFDENHQMYYFYNNTTKKSQWNAPYIPFRPFGWWPAPEPPRKAPAGFCSRCFLEKSTRSCHVCVDKDTGYHVEFCFACYAISHRENAELATHTFSIIADINNQFLTCVECHSQATRKCLDCDDAFCKAHYNSMHRRGNRAKHRSYGFSLGAPVCVECENDVALKFCGQCGDQFCLQCYAYVHRKGKKKLHKSTDMPSLEDGLDTVHSFVEEIRAKERAAHQDEDVNRKKKGGNSNPKNLKGAPKHDPPMKSFKLSKEGGGGGGAKPRPPPKNSRKEMALTAHLADGSGGPVRRNRPKNWRKMRPDKPPPKRKTEEEK